MTIFIRVAFLFEGALFVALGVPLAMKKVPPNAWYGFRTARTLASPEVWYTVNRSSGRDLILAGVPAGAALLLPMLLRARPPSTIALANVGVSVLALLTVAIRGVLKLQAL